MNEEVLSQQESRGRLIAHVFYSELEKISSAARLTRSGVREAISSGRKQLAAEIKTVRGSRPDTKWWQVGQKLKDRKAGTETIRKMKSEQRAYEASLRDKFRSDRAAALKDLTSPDAAKQEAARKFLGKPAAPKPKTEVANRKVPETEPVAPVSSPTSKPKKDAPNRNFAERVGRGVIGTTLVGGAGYGGYKLLKNRQNQGTPYSAYSGGY